MKKGICMPVPGNDKPRVHQVPRCSLADRYRTPHPSSLHAWRLHQGEAPFRDLSDPYVYFCSQRTPTDRYLDMFRHKFSRHAANTFYLELITGIMYKILLETAQTFFARHPNPSIAFWTVHSPEIVTPGRSFQALLSHTTRVFIDADAM